MRKVAAMGDTENTNIRAELTGELNAVLLALNNDEVPDEGRIENLEALFKQYFVLRQSKRSQKIQVKFDNVLPQKRGGNSISDPRFSDAENLKLLKRMVMEKLITVEEDRPEYPFLSYLQDIGYAAGVEIETEDAEAPKKYFMLTSRGWHALSLKKNLTLLQKTDPLFRLPKKMITDPKEWTETTFRNAVRLQEFFRKWAEPDYMIFPDASVPQLLFGCPVRETSAVQYCCSGLFDPEIDGTEEWRVSLMADSDEVDELIVVAQTPEEEQSLKKHQKLWSAQAVKKQHSYH